MAPSDVRRFFGPAHNKTHERRSGSLPVYPSRERRPDSNAANIVETGLRLAEFGRARRHDVAGGLAIPPMSATEPFAPKAASQISFREAPIGATPWNNTQPHGTHESMSLRSRASTARGASRGLHVSLRGVSMRSLRYEASTASAGMETL